MILSEKNTSKDEDCSSSNENEFQELDNEIEKVVRGKTSFEEENIEKNLPELNNTLNISKTSNSFIKNDMYQNKNKDYIKKASNIIDNMNENSKEKLFISNMMNKEKNNFNNINYYFFLKNNLNDINKSNQNNKFIEMNSKNKKNKQTLKNNMNNSNIFTINLNQNNNYMNSIYLPNYNNNIKDLLSLYYHKISNDYINNCQNLNNLNIYDNFNIINNNNNFWKENNLNINYNQLFSNSNTNNNICFSQFQGKRVNDNSNNNIIINNQFFTSNNINLDINNNNNKNESNQYFNIFNQYNHNNFNGNGFNDNINIKLSQNCQSNNMPHLGIYSLNNRNVYNQIRSNNQSSLIEQIENQLKYNQNLIELIKNNNVNNINNNSILNQINSQTNSNFKNIKKNNNKKQAYNGNQEKNNNIPIKRKIFNPLPDSEKEKNIINLKDVFQCKDLRTTLMIKNIPNKYTISTFLEEINYYFKGTYDIFYLPIDYINKCNLGFAFINFVEPLHIILFYELYRGKKWKKFNSDKMCELLYAKFQGRKELISHFEKGKVLSFDSEDKKPLILPVPRCLPKINLPCYYLKLFLKLYPNVSYEINNCDNNNNKGACSLTKIFSINGNFKMN